MAFFRTGTGNREPKLLGVFGGYKGSSGTNTDGLTVESTLEGDYSEYFSFANFTLTCIKACKIRWYITSKCGRDSNADTYAFVTQNGTEICRTIQENSGKVKANYKDIDCQVGDAFKVTQYANGTITVTNSIIFLI